MCVLNTWRDNHPSELSLNISDRFIAFLLDKQVVRVGILLQLALFENKNSISVNNCGNSVSYNEHGTIPEAFTERSLNQAICLEIQVDCRLVYNQNLCLSDDRTSDTE